MENVMSTEQPSSERKWGALAVVVWGIFVVYILVLLKVILFKNVHLEQFLSGNIGGYHAYNIIPFKTIYVFMTMEYIGFGRVFSNIVGNILVFMPLGYLLPLLLPKFRKFGRVLLFSTALSVLFEISQYVFMLGSLDVDDVILNTLGGAVGYGVYAVFSRIFFKERNFYKFTVICVCIVGCLTVGSLLILPHLNVGNEPGVNSGDAGMTITNENSAYGYVENISSNVITIHNIESKNFSDGSSLAASDTGDNAQQRDIYVDNSTKYEYNLIDSQGRIIESRKGKKSDIKADAILEVTGYDADGKFIANSVRITEVK